MPSIRRCSNKNCKYNLYGSICDGCDIVIDSDGCCEDFVQKEEIMCKDCKFYDEPDGDGWCYEHDRDAKPWESCSDGERKDNG